MKKQKILVTQSSMPTFEEYCEEIKDIWDRKWLTNAGPLHEKLKEDLKSYLKINNIELFTNGHLALEVALKALNLKGEIITTPFTFTSTTNAIINCGCTPVFCDINEDNYTIDVNKIESLITDKTVAIMPVHVYGAVCDVEGIKRIADKYGLKVIYDAAHCFAVEYNGKPISSFGDISMFSFHATKVFNTIEGGALTANTDDSLIKKFGVIRNFGLDNNDLFESGTNAKMSEFQAAMGICNLRHLDREIQKRKRASDLYDELLGEQQGLKVLNLNAKIKRNYAYYPVVVDEKKCGFNRDELVEKLAENNIFARKYFYPITNLFTGFSHYYDKYPTPIAKNISERVLCLPLYADLKEETVRKICKIIIDFKK